MKRTTRTESCPCSSCVCGQRCQTTFKNKCCITCLILLTLVIVLTIAAKIFINTVLNQVEEESFNSTFVGRIRNGKNRTKEIIEMFKVPKEVTKELPLVFSGFDLQNYPVWIVPFGTWDIKGLLNANQENEKLMKIYADQVLEHLLDSMSQTNVTKWVLLADMTDYSYSQLTSINTISFEVRVIRKYEPLFDTLAYGYTVNLDFLSRTFVNIAKPLLGSVMDRIEMHGSDEDEYIPAILKNIPKSQLPEKYGGSKDHQPVQVLN